MMERKYFCDILSLFPKIKNIYHQSKKEDIHIKYLAFKGTDEKITKHFHIFITKLSIFEFCLHFFIQSAKYFFFGLEISVMYFTFDRFFSKYFES